jgi:hypothetical protein
MELEQRSRTGPNAVVLLEDTGKFMVYMPVRRALSCTNGRNVVLAVVLKGYNRAGVKVNSKSEEQ